MAGSFPFEAISFVLVMLSLQGSKESRFSFEKYRYELSLGNSCLE